MYTTIDDESIKRDTERERETGGGERGREGGKSYCSAIFGASGVM